jgi:transposase-like protein
MSYTIKQFNEEYPDDAACLAKVFTDKYGDLETCPQCKKATKFYKVAGRKCYACEHCGYQLHPLANTIFHKSSTSLKNWFYAIYLFSVSKNGVSAKELQRHIGVTYKCAHRMCAQIRKLMAGDDTSQLQGDVEIDETYIGGRRRMCNKMSNKSVVFGMVERNGKVIAKKVISSGSRALLPEIDKSIMKGATIHSDEWPVYGILAKRGYAHTTVTHRTLEYVRGASYTNTIEGFWSQLKRSIDGTFHCVSPKYLQQYVDEFSFRYNFRKENNAVIFNKLVDNIA